MSEADYSFGSWVRLRRRSLLISREQLAQRVGCAEVTIRKIESDERRASSQIAQLLAQHLGLEASQYDVFVRVARGILPVDQLPSALPVLPSQPIALSQPAPIADHIPRKSNLPVLRTTVIGREQELMTLRPLLTQTARLLTITGAGGTGKTTLVIQLATELGNEYHDAAWFIDLSSVTDSDQIPALIAQILSIPEASDRPLRETVLHWLQSRQLLLVLDNCEQIIDGVATFVADLLRSAAQVAVLATSRIALRVSHEQEYQLMPLALPEGNLALAAEQLSGYAAIRLFVMRSCALRPDFRLSQENADAICEICRRLDGLPLAIELAAARMRLFSPEQLLQQLKAAGLQRLAGGARDAPMRQQTMKATVDWSYQLLTTQQQILLRRLSIFVGGWTLEAAEAVCGQDLDVMVAMEALLEQSLVQRIENRFGPRYRLLETIRAYAHEQLMAQTEDHELHVRHAIYFTELAEEAEPKLRSREQAECLERLILEDANIQAVLTWCLENQNDIKLGIRLAAALWFAWLLQGSYDEARRWQNGSWASDDTLSAKHRAWLLIGRQLVSEWAAGGLRFVLEHLNEQGLDFVRQAHDPICLCFALANLAVHKHDFLGRHCLDYAQESLILAADLQDSWLHSYALAGLGVSQYLCNQDKTTALLTLQQALLQAQSLQEHWLLGMLYWSRGHIRLSMHDYELALEDFHQQIEHCQALGNRINAAFALWGAGFALQQLGHLKLAHTYQEQRLNAEIAAGNSDGVISTLWALTHIDVALNQYKSAEMQLKECLAICEEHQRSDNIIEFCIWLSLLALEQGHSMEAESWHSQSLAQIQRFYPEGNLPSWLIYNQSEYDLYLGNLTAAQERINQALQKMQYQAEEEQDWMKLLRGRLLRRNGRLAEALPILEECGKHYGYFGDTFVLRESRPELAYTLLGLGNLSSAAQHFREALRFYKQAEMLGHLAWNLEGSTMLIAAQSQYHSAARLWGAAEALREQIGAPMWSVDRPDYERRVAAARQQCPPDVWEASWAAGRTMGWEEAVEEALDGLEVME